MSLITVKKAAIKESLFLEVGYDQQMSPTVTDKFKRNSTAPVHDDLKAAFKLLDLHLALICEEITVEQFQNAGNENNIVIQMTDAKGKKAKSTLFGAVPEPDIRDVYSVDTFAFTGDSAGVVLDGSKILKSGKVMYITTPLTKWTDDYPMVSELAEAIDICTNEILLFLTEGKVAPSKQHSIEFPEKTGTEPKDQTEF